jgi:hypothetical protein
MRDRPLEIKRSLSLLFSFINLTQHIKNTCKTYSDASSNTNTTNNIVSRIIYNPKHYIDESPNPDRRPLESFHKVIIALCVTDYNGHEMKLKSILLLPAFMLLLGACGEAPMPTLVSPTATPDF